MSIKTSADEWVRKGPTQAIAVIAAVGIVIGGLIGLGIGYKIEQSRTKSDVSNLQKQLRAKTTPKTAATGALGQRVGKVTATGSGSLTVTTKQRGAQTIVTNNKTVFESTVRATIADVRSGRRILVTPGGKEIIVLAESSKLGRVVAAVGSASINIAKGNGFPAGEIKTKDVHVVYTLKAGTVADVKTGDPVLVGGRAKDDKTFTAIEAIVLPADSGFAT
jgi:hypothetical protein